MQNFDVIIIGAGAAGLMCAITAGARGRRVLIIDHNDAAGLKIAASGGGRCNFTNTSVGPENYLSSNPHFVKSALARFTPNDFISILKKHKIEFSEKEKGQLFCKTGAKNIVNMLLSECREANVVFKFSCKIKSIEKNEGFVVTTNSGDFSSEALVGATGGLSYNSLGASGLGHEIAKQFKLKIVPCRPALVPLLLGGQDKARFSKLSGISISTKATCNGYSFAGGLLFTHKGLSGPAILQVSSFFTTGSKITIDLFPNEDAYELFLSKKKKGDNTLLRNIVSYHHPRRFVELWDKEMKLQRPTAKYSEGELKKIAHDLHNWEINPCGTEGYEHAEATVGGVDTDEISSKTMESKKVSGLYFIGEVLDVIGWLGGYNLQWAWASGHAAGESV